MSGVSELDCTRFSYLAFGDTMGISATADIASANDQDAELLNSASVLTGGGAATAVRNSAASGCINAMAFSGGASNQL